MLLTRRRFRTLLHITLALAYVAGIAGCDKNSPTAPDTAEPFTASILDVANIQYITPVGMMNVLSHTFPTAHTYWYRNGGNTIVNVYAPAGGRVLRLERGVDDTIVVEMTDEAEYYLGHVKIKGEINENTILTAGQNIGTSSDLALAVDFGILNRAITRYFVVPARYPQPHRHAEHPLVYYAEPLKSELLGKNPGKGDKFGRNTYDQDNTLAGNWFLEGTPVNTDAAGPSWWHAYVAFVYDPVTPSQVIVSYGPGLGLNVNGFPNGGPLGAISGPAPESVNTGSGMVMYRITGYISIPGNLSPVTQATVIVQMLDGRRIRVQGFPGAPGNPVFDGGAKIYVR